MKGKIIYSILIAIFLLYGFGKIDLKIKNKGYYKLSKLNNESNKSDSAIINGRIFDLKSRKVLPYSRFELKDFKAGCLANDSGYFEIKVKADIYKFNFACAGNTDLITKKIKIDANVKYYFIVYLDTYELYQNKKP